MTRAVASEALKLRTTRTFYGVTLGAIAIVVLISAIAPAAEDFSDGNANAKELLTIAGFAQTFALVLGILAVSTEFRHGTITPSLLVGPDRTRLVLAKLIAHVAVGVALGLVCFGLCAALVLGILGARDIETGVDSGDVIAIIAGGTAATALVAALGVGLGALVRNQVGAIVGALAYLLAIEPLIGIIPGIDDAVAKFGFNGVVSGLSGTSDGTGTDLLAALPAGLLLAGYAAAFVVAGIVLMRRRDISA